MEEYRSYTRSVSFILLALGGFIGLMGMGSVAMFLMTYAFEMREPAQGATALSMGLSAVLLSLVGGFALVGFFMRKSRRGWRLIRLYGGLLALAGLALPLALMGEAPGIPPIASVGAVLLGFCGMWILLVTGDRHIREAHAAAEKS